MRALQVELPAGSMRSPHAARIKKEKWNQLSDKEKISFLPFAPAFFLEVLSTRDKLVTARAKMQKWIQNRTQLGWLIVAKEQSTFIYPADGTVAEIIGFDKRFRRECFAWF